MSTARAGTVSWFERRSCLGKVPFASDHEARAAARAIERRRSLDPYGCRFCVSWHVGHQLARH